MTTPITTTTQLEALPDGSVMRGKDDTLIERGTTPVASSPCTWIDGSWFLLPETIDLYAPLTVLHVPGQAVDCDHAALAHDLAKTTVLGLASAEEVVRAATTLATPAPTVKPGREGLIRVLFDQLPPDWDESDIGILADAVLAILPGKTEQEVRAQALRDAVEARAIEIPDRLGYNVRAVTVEDLLDLADEEAGK